MEERKQIRKDHFTSNESKSRIKSVRAKLENFHDTKDATRSKKKLQKERGVDKTYLVTDRIPYKSTKAKTHLVQLQEELKAQKESGQLSEEESRLNYTGIVKILKCIDGDKTSFVPKTSFFQNFLIDGGLGNTTEEQEVNDPNLDGEMG